MPGPRPPHQIPPAVPAAARFIGAVFGIAFFGIGLTVIAFLWFGDDGFHEPPVFFKLFGSFIAMVFVAVGGAMAVSAITGGGLMKHPRHHFDARATASSPAPPPTSVTYNCPNCAAALGKDADVSPLGDVKCPFCGRWFNIHRE